MRFRTGDKVEAVTGLKGDVIFTDSNRNIVAVSATNEGVGHREGSERVFSESEVREDTDN